MNNGIVFNLTKTAPFPHTSICIYLGFIVVILFSFFMFLESVETKDLRKSKRSFFFNFAFIILIFIMVAGGVFYSWSHVNKDLDKIRNYKEYSIVYSDFSGKELKEKDFYDKLKEHYNLIPYTDNDSDSWNNQKDSYKDIKSGVIHRDCDEHFKKINSNQVKLTSITCGSEILK